MRTSVLSMWMTGYRAQHWLNDTEALTRTSMRPTRCSYHATEVLHPQCSYAMDHSSSRLRKDLENFFTT
eukprot:1619475-Pleurochrysis_carterae.AAC.1